MTIKEIAELCGVDRTTVLRWAHKVSDDPVHFAQGLTIKLEEAEKSGRDPADFTLEETLAIIRAGGNDTLANLLAENAKNKEALAVQTGGFSQAITPQIEKAVYEVVYQAVQAAVSEQLDGAVDRLLDRVLSPQERQMRGLNDFLSRHIEITGDNGDYIIMADLYRQYKDYSGNPVSREAFPTMVSLICPNIKVVRREYSIQLIGCRLL
ncbi:MAG: hypothetical protein LBB80_07960 [Treponema sp.]|nr:hypothetical protein [Treponema sp.]